MRISLSRYWWRYSVLCECLSQFFFWRFGPFGPFRAVNNYLIKYLSPISYERTIISVGLRKKKKRSWSNSGCSSPSNEPSLKGVLFTLNKILMDACDVRSLSNKVGWVLRLAEWYIFLRPLCMLENKRRSQRYVTYAQFQMREGRMSCWCW